MKNYRALLLIIVMSVVFGVCVLTVSAWAEDPDTAALAKASQNPVSSLISVPFENNTNFGVGPWNGTDNILNIKPVYPISITENWNLINRAILPVIYLDNRKFDVSTPAGKMTIKQDSEFGIGDLTYQGFISPAKPGKLIWGVGPALVMPTGNDHMTSEKWSIGPSAVLLTMPGNWVIGTLLQNVWSVGGKEYVPDVNQGVFQYFINYNMKGGWYVTMAPTITANWEAEAYDDVWTVPVGGGFGRVFKIGKQPVNLKLAAYYNVVKPDFGADWTLQTQLTFMFPK